MRIYFRITCLALAAASLFMLSACVWVQRSVNLDEYVLIRTTPQDTAESIAGEYLGTPEQAWEIREFNRIEEVASEDEIRQWIEDNIDFSDYKNKMQAMGTIMAHFGSTADGNTVKQVLQQFSA